MEWVNTDGNWNHPPEDVSIDLLCAGETDTFTLHRHDGVSYERGNNETYPLWLEFGGEDSESNSDSDSESDTRERLWTLLERETLWRYKMENYSES